MRDRWLLVSVFAGGMTTLGVELSASRLLGNVFGTSNIVWANIIGLILIYLTVGYFLGGRWADRSPHRHTFYRILTWGAFSAGLVPIAARPVLGRAVAAFAQFDAAILAGSFLAVFWLIPALGTARTFLAFSLGLQSVALIGLYLSSGPRSVLRLLWMPVLPVVPSWVSIGGPLTG